MGRRESKLAGNAAHRRTWPGHPAPRGEPTHVSSDAIEHCGAVRNQPGLAAVGLPQAPHGARGGGTTSRRARAPAGPPPPPPSARPRPPPPPTPPPDDWKANPALKTVYFAFDSMKIRPGDAKTLDASADWLKANP